MVQEFVPGWNFCAVLEFAESEQNTPGNIFWRKKLFFKGIGKQS
jgi:hypothetical protein